MKIIITIAAMCCSLYAQAQEGISFATGNWATALSEAKKENKLVFLDVYTSWCGPCKMMARDVFPQKPVADYYNSTFVNFKIDAEKGEGVEIAKQYEVRGYPTYLFVNGDGKAVYRLVGAVSPQRFVVEAKRAVTLSKDTRPLAQWKKDFESGSSDKAFLLGYLAKLRASSQYSVAAVEKLFPLLTPAELSALEVLSLLYVEDEMLMLKPGGHAINYLLQHYEEIRKQQEYIAYMGQMGIKNYIIREAMPGVDKALFTAAQQNMQALTRLINDPAADIAEKELDFLYYAKGNDSATIMHAAESYAQRVSSQDTATTYPGAIAYPLLEIANVIYNKGYRGTALDKGLAWAKQAMEYEPQAAMKAVYAGLLFRSGKRQSAVAIMENLLTDRGVVRSEDKLKSVKENLALMKSEKEPVAIW